MRPQQGFVSVILVIIIVTFVATTLGALLIAKKQLLSKKEQPQVLVQEASPSPKPETTPQPASLLFGLWEAEKMFIYDQEKRDWQETQLTAGVYFDFKEDGTTCGLWSIDKGYQCHNYNDTYKVEGDRIIIERKNQQWKIGETAIPSTQVYNWKIVDSKLELTGIGSFSPVGVRYISRQTPYPQPK